MVNVDPRALWIANSAFNAAGVLSAAKAWGSFFNGKQKQFFCLVLALLLSAWLETIFNEAFPGLA